MKEINLSKGLKCQVDDSDFENLNQFIWHVKQCRKRAYAHRGGNGKSGSYMHREIMNVSNPEISVDHIDGNPLNNQRSNLRTCTHAQNICNSKLNSKNTSGYRGVTWHTGAKKYMAYIRHNYKMYNLGLFETAEEAALARNEKAVKLHGEFAVLNVIP